MAAAQVGGVGKGKKAKRGLFAFCIQRIIDLGEC